MMILALVDKSTISFQSEIQFIKYAFYECTLCSVCTVYCVH